MERDRSKLNKNDPKSFVFLGVHAESRTLMAIFTFLKETAVVYQQIHAICPAEVHTLIWTQGLRNLGFKVVT